MLRPKAFAPTSLTFLAVSALALAGCTGGGGGSDDPSSETASESSSPTAGDATAQEAEVELDDSAVGEYTANDDARTAFDQALASFENSAKFEDDDLAGLDGDELATVGAGSCAALDAGYDLPAYHRWVSENHRLTMSDGAVVIYFGRMFCEDRSDDFETFFKEN
ncbi:hypothetical protein [Salininema proteolyticum]|uniref:Lipoprotein n=1 Tax=Salininema proteolyticum TaxID=1607685 RepID=A0ABV8TWI0_9ACTN